jgi:hypothetical protein
MAKLVSVICVALVAGCVQTTATEKPNGKKADMSTLQGDWVAVSHDLVGTQVTFKDEYEPYKLSIVDDNVDETIGTKTTHGKVELNEPNNITFTIANRGQWGVYKVDGDKLIITWATGKNIEPKESAKASFVLERAKQ